MEKNKCDGCPHYKAGNCNGPGDYQNRVGVECVRYAGRGDKSVIDYHNEYKQAQPKEKSVELKSVETELLEINDLALEAILVAWNIEVRGED